ncbi:alkaline phosphatase D family protein [Stutzerimonas kirkiae]|uniref:alkaline phosphatase D family protein n=1 Tax=Stutzerimonas kirkiae TaxID=2211392 RepID=UPI0010384734|nr:alkaline phosphatase D family protein [Stutzerimonas kirkiae]TBV10497.1 alkaline phosphatase [Stutzerimonas kirkiae]
MPSHTFGRRQALRLLAGAAAAPWFLQYGRALAGQDYPFGLGVASGDPAHDGFVIWTRLSSLPLYPGNEERLPNRVPLTWEVAEDANFRRIVQRGQSNALRLLGHAVHVELHNLRPGREYWYRFIALGDVSPSGRAITLPSPTASPERLHLVVASCANWERGYFSAYRHMAEERPDLTLFLGDYIYEYSLPTGAADLVRPYGAAEATDLAGYRYRYALHHSDPDLQALHAAAPCLATWDDHEVQDDYSGEHAKDPAVRPAEFIRRRAAAYQAFLENLPLRRPAREADGRPRIYRSFRYGQLASLPVLDGRQYRSRQPCPVAPHHGKGHLEPATCQDLRDPKRTLLGFAQERWLYDQLRNSDSRWQLIAQNLLVAPLRIPAAMPDEDRYWTDNWDGFQAARDRLLESLHQSRVANPVILSGDYHSFWANHLHLRAEDPQSPRVATELVGTSITSNGPSYESVQAIMPVNPHVRFYDSRSRGYLSLDLDRTRLEVRMQAISERADPHASLATLKRFSVESGDPRLHPG